MIGGPTLYLVVATALGCGLMSGALYAFSSFVMAGLGRMPTDQGMAAMQSINVTAVRPPFMLGFFGTAAASVAVSVVAVANWDRAPSVWLLAGAGSYLLGVVAMTSWYHVPRNNLLAATDPTSANAEQVWQRYLVEWTRWNHLRVIAGLVAAVLLTIAIRIS